MWKAFFFVKYEIEKTDLEAHMCGFCPLVFSLRWLVFPPFLPGGGKGGESSWLPILGSGMGAEGDGALCSFDLIPLSLAPHVIAAFSLPWVLEAKVSLVQYSQRVNL